MITKLEIYGIAILLLAVGMAGAYWYAYHQGVMHERGVWETKAAVATQVDLNALSQAVQRGNEIAMGTQDLLNKKRATSVIDRGVLEREIRTNTIYAADCLPPTGLLQWDSISKTGAVLPDRSAQQQPNSAVPSGDSAAAAGRQGRVAPAQPSSSTRNIR